MDNDNGKWALSRTLREFVAAGAPGDRLPSVRSLQNGHGVSPLTVQHVVRELTAEGLVTARPGAGTFIARPPASTVLADTSWQQAALGGHRVHDSTNTLALFTKPEVGVIRLTGGYLDDTLVPVAALSAAMGRAARRSGTWGRSPVEGRENLRQWFARELGGVDASSVIVTAGGQAALSISIRALTRPGESIVLESPTYAGAISVARSYGLELAPVPVDGRGMRTDLLAAVLERTRARVILTQPLFANPTGITMAAERRAELMEIAQRYSVFVIEDDYARDLAIEKGVPAALASNDPHGHVVYLRSLTKQIAAGLRVAGIVVKGTAYARLRAAKALEDIFVAGALQETAVDFVNSPAWATHKRKVAVALAGRRDALVTSLTTMLPELEITTRPRGGMHLWVRLPEGLDEAQVTAAALAEGVAVTAGAAWFPAESDGAHLRLTYGETAAELIPEGVARLTRAIHGIQRGAGSDTHANG
jgi:DNA-binding transcriptional MocR family regulator